MKDDPETYAIIGAAMEVHRILGCGFLEAVYQEAFEMELNLRGIPYRREVELPIQFKGQELKKMYRVDFICYDDTLVELKALDKMSGVEQSKLLNYLKASESPKGLLINFGAQSLEYQRFVN